MPKPNIFKRLPYYCLMTAAMTLAACSGDSGDDNFDSPINDRRLKAEVTRATFNPGAGDLPVPNDLLFAGERQQDGTMFAGNDANPVIQGIDALDGNSVLAPIDIAFSSSLDPAQTLDARNFITEGSQVIPNPDQNVFLLSFDYPGGDSLVQTSTVVTDASGNPVTQDLIGIDGKTGRDAMGNPVQIDVTRSVEIPTIQEAAAFTVGSSAVRAFLAQPAARAEIISLDGGLNNVIRINPLKPLQPETKYLVVITNVTDALGEKIEPSIAYNTLSDPSNVLTGPLASLGSVQAAITGWESAAAGYFAFMNGQFATNSLPYKAPSADDIIFSLTFTTGGTDSVLTSMAAPESFFAKSIATRLRKDAILDLLQTNPNADYIAQKTAAETAVATANAATPNIAQTAAGTVQAILAGINQVDPSVTLSDVFPIPADRDTTFFRADSADTIFPGLSPANTVYQGEITLPYYQTAYVEGSTGSSAETGIVLSSTWNSSKTIAGVAPPSDAITYRFPFPAKTSDITVPLLATMPNAAVLSSAASAAAGQNVTINKPANGWPVIIFIHGITGDRSFALPMANAMGAGCVLNPMAIDTTGSTCFATIAIDQPLHGIPSTGATLTGANIPNFSDMPASFTPNIPAGNPNTVSAALTERHFGLTSGGPGVAIPMTPTVGASGSNFINLLNFANVRDNLRQMSVDLSNLTASIANMDIDADGNLGDIDPARIYLVGHSLGGIDSIPFIAINNSDAVQNSPFSNQPKINAASIMLSGGGITRLLSNSQSFAPSILPGLAQASDALAPGTSGLETYFSVFQGVLDSVDPMGFAPILNDNNGSTGILLTEVIGNGSTNLPDQTIPNAADESLGTAPLNTVVSDGPAAGFMITNLPAPLAGTEPLVNQFAATNTADATSDGDAAVLITRFTAGTHGTPVDTGITGVDANGPIVNPDSRAVFTELVLQQLQFFSANGDVAGSIVGDTSVVE